MSSTLCSQTLGACPLSALKPHPLASLRVCLHDKKTEKVFLCVVQQLYLQTLTFLTTARKCLLYTENNKCHSSLSTNTVSLHRYAARSAVKQTMCLASVGCLF